LQAVVLAPSERGTVTSALVFRACGRGKRGLGVRLAQRFGPDPPLTHANVVQVQRALPEALSARA